MEVGVGGRAQPDLRLIGNIAYHHVSIRHLIRLLLYRNLRGKYLPRVQPTRSRGEPAGLRGARCSFHE